MKSLNNDFIYCYNLPGECSGTESNTYTETSGIGKAAAKTFIDKGHTVYGGDIQVEENLYLNDIGGHAQIIDVTKNDQVNAGVQKLIDEQGRIDVLINNAGYGSFATIENIDMDELQNQFDVNVFGYARLQQADRTHMPKQRTGLVIEISSVVGEISYPMPGWYAATKHAVRSHGGCASPGSSSIWY